MKCCILSIIVMATATLYGATLIYDTGFSRREIMPPITGYLVMDTLGNFSELPDLQSGEAMVLFSDGVRLRYSIIPEPTKKAPVIIYENGSAKPIKKDQFETELTPEQKAYKDYANELTKLPQEQREHKIKERRKQIDAKRAIIDRERAKLNSGYYEEEKRKAIEELKKMGY